MSVLKNHIVQSLLFVVVALLASCSPQDDGGGQQGPPAPATNRLDVPPEVVNNLGIRFETASRGRMGIWRELPGELEVPESRRWTLRAPSAARVVAVVPRWHVVEEGAVVATLTSPALQEAQRAITFAERTLERATAEVIAAHARLGESETHLQEARAFEQASRHRLEELRALGAGGNALSARELIAARRDVIDASKARLDSAIARDDLVSRVANKRLEADQARLEIGERLSALAVLTGTSVAVLGERDERGAAWQQLEVLEVRAPAAGTVVELMAAQGEILEKGAALVQVFDSSELRFRGHLPEGDLGALAEGNRVRLEFPSRHLQPVETVLTAPLPIADPGTRMIHVGAVVPNPDGRLVHAMSVMAQVLLEESANEEVLIPARCVVFDGLEAIVFKRDPNDPNVVIRTPIELGARAVGQIEVLAGVLDGDAVVGDGIHQLKQTGLGKAPEGGHFHADGTWHGGDK